MLQTQITCPVVVEISCTRGMPTSLPPKYGMSTSRPSVCSHSLRSQLNRFCAFSRAGYIPHLAASWLCIAWDCGPCTTRKLGRASWRESGWLYVYLHVEHSNLKKITQQKIN